MNKEKFWEIIDRARAKGLYHIDNAIEEDLLNLEKEEIFHWNKIFMEYRKLMNKNKLLAAAIIMQDGYVQYSPYGNFESFHCLLIIQGKEVLLNALRDPDWLAEIDISVVDFEYMIFVATQAYKKKYNLIEDSMYYYEVMSNYQITEKEKEDIRQDIIYADDINIKIDIMKTLYTKSNNIFPKILPKLCEKYKWQR
jgi:hypothetical protein